MINPLLPAGPLLSDKPRVVLANVTPNNPTRGSLTNQQRWRDDQFQVRISPEFLN